MLCSLKIKFFTSNYLEMGWTSGNYYNFTFTLLEEGSLACSCHKNFLAVLKKSENYESLQNGLSDIRAEVKDLETIEQNGIQFKLVYYLGGDLNFLAIATSIDRASS